MSPSVGDAIRESARLIQSGEMAGAWSLLEPWLDTDNAAIHANASVAASRMGRAEVALAHARRAAALDPVLPVGPYQVGQLLAENDEPSAVEAYDEALRRRPDFALAHGARGACLLRLGRIDEAEQAFHRALELEPRLPHVLQNMANVAIQRDQLERAVVWFEKALELAPETAPDDVPSATWHSIARRSLGMAQLAAGEYAAGWENYRWRWHLGGQILPAPDLSAPVWSGEPLEGRRLALVAEQGHGDALQFLRYASVLAELGAHVVAVVRPNLRRWAACVPGVAEVADGPAPEVDLQVPMLEVPRLTNLLAFEQAPRPRVDGISPHPDVPVEGRGVGIHWSAGPILRETKTFPLAPLAPLAEVPEARLYSLQFDDTDALDECGFPIGDLRPWLGDFYDTARVVMRMELVITADTAMAHLAATLSVPTLVLLPTPADWRWYPVSTQTVWYPAMELFRQEASGRWDEPLAAVVRRVSELLSE